MPACLACLSVARTPWRTTRAMMHDGGERFSFVRCDACGLVYLDPRVPAAELARFYTEAYLPYRGSAAWGRWSGVVAAGIRATDRRRVERVRRHVRLDESTRVLDVGCGRPSFLEAVGRAAQRAGGPPGDGARVGIDFSDAGWRDDPARWDGMELHRGTLAEWAGSAKCRTRPFDVVTMWHYLEHDYAPGETLTRLCDLAAPHTRLIIEVPDHGSWSRRRYDEHWAGYHTPRHTAIWDRDTILLLLERTGWRVESIEPVGTLDPWILAWMSRQERAGIDWSGSMESRFVSYVLGRAIVWPFFALRARLRGQGGDGFLTAVARRA